MISKQRSIEFNDYFHLVKQFSILRNFKYKIEQICFSLFPEFHFNQPEDSKVFQRSDASPERKFCK